MSEPRTGGVAVKVLSGRAAPSLQRYRDSKEDEEPPLFMATRHCSLDVETQIAEWKAVRVEHGTQGRTRASRGKYETVDPDTGLHASGQRGTHVKYWDGQRKQTRPVRQGETPTHLYVAPEALVPQKESEATHSIYAFGADMVNPEDPEAMERAFLAVKAERDEHYPGLQESMWGERNGESGLFHVHVASNATVYRGFRLDGADYVAGQKMGKGILRKDDVRARFEQYLDAHPEYEMQQSLARVGTKEYEDAQRRDGQHAYWERARAEREGKAAKETNQDRIRREAYEALSAGGVVDRYSFVAEMKARGIAVDETGLRRGKRGRGYDLRFKLDGAKQGVKGTTLGPAYAHDVIDAQLVRRAQDLDVEMPSERQRVGEAAQIPLTSPSLSDEEQAELKRLKRDVSQLAQTERARQYEERQQVVREQQVADRRQEEEAIEASLKARIARDDADMQPHFDADAQDALDRIQHGPVEAEKQPVAEVQEEPVGGIPGPPPAAPQGPEPFRSRIQDMTSKSAGMQERYAKLAPFEERWVGRLPSTPEERRRFEQEAAEIGIGRLVVRNTQGVMDPGLHEYLAQRVEHAEQGARAVARKKELDQKVERLEDDARSDPFDLRGTAQPLRSAKADRRFEAGYIYRVRADHAAGVYTSREHERFEHRETKVESAAAELEPTEAEKSLQEGAERLRNDRSASRDRSHDDVLDRD